MNRIVHRWWRDPAGSSAQAVEQLPRAPQVRRAEALGEPAVDGGEQVLRPPPLAAIGPEAGERGRGAKLPHPGVLRTGDGKGPAEADLGPAVLTKGQQQLAPEAVELRRDPACPGRLDPRQRLNGDV